MTEARDPAERLLAEAPVPAAGRLLILEGGEGDLLEHFAAPGREIHFHNSDALAHGAASLRPAAGSPGNRLLLSDLPRAAAADRPADEEWPDVSEYPPAHFDAILYRLGKGTASLHAAIRESWSLLQEGGLLFIAGHTREGMKSVAKRAEAHFGNAELMGLKSSCRLIGLRKAGSLPTEPMSDPEYWKPVRLALDAAGQGTIPYLTKPGVFAYRATDPGTALLGKHLGGHGSPSGKRVLDLCCGCGVLGLAAHRMGALEVTASDANAAAVSAARRNFREAGSAAQVHCTNLTDGIRTEFDLILANPPFHRGAETDYGLPARVLDAALPRLAAGGRMLLVANQFLDYPAQARLRAHACEEIARENGFRVLSLSR